MSAETPPLDPKIDAATAEVLTLGGREWFLPVLAVRQNRKVVPGLGRLMPIVNVLASRPQDLTENDYNDLVSIVHVALTRAYPSLTLDQFLDQTFNTIELIEALGPIARQTGLLRPRRPGEAKGEVTPPTSIESSPSIAQTPESPGQTS